MTAKKPKKMGRPKLPKGLAKGVIVPVRVSPQDRKLFKKAAMTDGHKTLSGWIRQTLRQAADTEHHERLFQIKRSRPKFMD
jgi:uncharacterized protein (DUF1778 family)